MHGRITSFRIEKHKKSQEPALAVSCGKLVRRFPQAERKIGVEPRFSAPKKMGVEPRFWADREIPVRPQFLRSVVRRLPQVESGKTVSGDRNRGAVSVGAAGNESPCTRALTGPGFGYGGQHADRLSSCCAIRIPEASFEETNRAGNSRGGGRYPCPGADSNRRLSSLSTGGFGGLYRNTGVEPATLRLTVVCSTH